jgi:hypothetical protein
MQSTLAADHSGRLWRRQTRRTFLGCALAGAATTGPVLAQPSSELFPEPLGWRPHAVKRGNGRGGWTLEPADFRFLHRATGSYVFPFGLAPMDNGELALAASWHTGKDDLRPPEKPVLAFSRDSGDTWTEFIEVTGALGRPMALTYLGNGQLLFQTDLEKTVMQHFSRDYGRTWPEHQPLQTTLDGQSFGVEGNFLVERDQHGLATRIGALGWCYRKGHKWPLDPATGILRWSTDGGRSWTNEVAPDVWLWDDEYQGRKYRRGVSEGSLIRAANGSLVAALRTDIPAQYLAYKNQDSLEGTAVSISKDDGRTWSPLRFLYRSGRHHAHLLRLAGGALVMTLIVRDDIQDGKLASYRRGCEAVLSRDHGQTWDLGHKYVLDEFEFLDGINWYNGETGHLSSALLPDGRILTAYGKYVSKGANLIRWKPA